ncbi:hypothetical protein LINPERHAP2_LOCUS17286 [Linum perenne]
MIAAFKAIGASSFTTITKQPPLLLIRRPSTRNSFLCFSKPTDSDSDSDSNSSPPPQGGDTRRQELLARIVLLQTDKVRLTDYLDERSNYLTQFAQEANAEIDKIGEDALTRLDEASSRIMENIEKNMQSFEESAEMNRAEIQENEDKLVEFEDKIVKERNEGLFFKSLGTTTTGQKAPIDKVKAVEEAQKIKDLAKAKAESATRRNIYLALIALLVFTIAESFVASSPDWRKVAVLGAILVGLVTQVSYEQNLSSDIEKSEKDKADKE